MRFQVPQFIEKESQIVGPLTLKQFAWLGGGAFLMFMFFIIFPFVVFIILSVLVAAAALALAFLKIDQMPLPNYLMNFINYLLNPKQYKYKQK